MEIKSNSAAAPVAADIALSSGNQTPSQSQETAPVLESSPSKDSPKLSAEQAKKEAKELEALLNRPSDTEIKFNVKLISTNGSEEQASVTDFKFQVVEKGTGKVVRQFPPEDMNGVKERASAIPTISGILIHSVA